MMDTISYVFAQKLDKDDRLPFLTFDVGGDTFGLYSPSIPYWTLCVVVLLLCAIFSAFMATIIYFVIIPRRGSMIAYLTGFGIVIPICTCYFPFMVLDALDLRNKVLRFAVTTVYPVLTMFRTSEAMFGFSPRLTELSYKNYLLYITAALEIQFDEKTGRPVPAKFNDFVAAIKKFLTYLFILGSYKSLIGSSLCEPFETDVDGSSPHYNLMDMFDLNLLRNNFVATMLLQLYLSTYTAGIAILATGILGVIVQDSMDNPLMKATSPSNFWSGRWNVLIHGALKRGVFKPVYSVSTKFIAVLATFLASGLFHEYILVGTYPPHLGFTPAYGKQTAFMAWNAGLIIVEAIIGKAKIFSWIQKNVPKPIVTFLVLCTAMPVAHWFLHQYTKSGMFLQGDIAVPMMKKIS